MASESKETRSGSATAYRTRPVGPVLSVNGHMPMQAIDPWSVVRYGYCSQEDADVVWNACVNTWGFASSDKEMRMGLMVALAQAFCYSTSKDLENLSTVVHFADRKIPIKTIHEQMSVYFQGSNDSLLRVFVRSYKRGTFVLMQYNLLNDPANVELRAEIASRGEASQEHAPYMFDTADTLVKAGVSLTYEQTLLVSKYKAVLTRKALASAVSNGLIAPKNDVSNVGVRRPHQAAVSTSSQPISQDQRAALTSTNLR